MKKNPEKTDLLLNSDGSIYHLNLYPDELAETIILVGDPGRVPQVSEYFDCIDIEKAKREFITHTGKINDQRISVVSTGIGTGNIDIVINECDALHNFNFKNNSIKETITPLRFIRLGTCGAFLKEVDVDALILSTAAIGIDGLMSFYEQRSSKNMEILLANVKSHFRSLPAFSSAYVAEADDYLRSLFQADCYQGITLTCSGFYGPQYRSLRVPLISKNIFNIAQQFLSEHGKIINVEMETAAIYGLSSLLGHQACSISVVLDNVITQTVSKDIQKAINQMIKMAVRVISPAL